MQRLKIAKNLNIRQAMLVENAYYTARPPERVTVEKEERTPLQQYIRHLVHDQLAQDEPKQVTMLLSAAGLGVLWRFRVHQCRWSSSAGQFLSWSAHNPKNNVRFCKDKNSPTAAHHRAMFARCPCTAEAGASVLGPDLGFLCACAMLAFLSGSNLTNDLVLQIVRKLRRLPWSDNEFYLIRTLLGASVGRYSLAPSLASLTAGLSRYHPSLRIGVIDSLLEEVQYFPITLLCICLFPLMTAHESSLRAHWRVLFHVIVPAQGFGFGYCCSQGRDLRSFLHGLVSLLPVQGLHSLLSSICLIHWTCLSGAEHGRPGTWWCMSAEYQISPC